MPCCFPPIRLLQVAKSIRRSWAAMLGPDSGGSWQPTKEEVATPGEPAYPAGTHPLASHQATEERPKRERPGQERPNPEEAEGRQVEVRCAIRICRQRRPRRGRGNQGLSFGARTTRLK